MEKKETAVQWLIDQIDSIIPYVNEETAKKFNAIVQKSIQMEREQIEEAFEKGWVERKFYSEMTSGEYYTQTFNP